MKDKRIYELIKLLIESNNPNEIANVVIRLMNEDKEFFKAMHIAMFNNEI